MTGKLGILENDPTQDERGDRFRRFALAAGIFIAVISIAIIALRPRSARQILTPVPPETLLGALREGTPEFDSHQKYVTVEGQSAVESENLLGQVTVVVKGVLHNRGERDLTGVELRAVVSDIDNQIVAERVAVPVPKLRPKLAAKESMVVHVNIDPVPRKGVRANGVILLRGLKFD